MLAAESRVRVVRMEYEGIVYFPVVRSGIVLGPEELAQLVATPVPVRRVRRFDAIVAHENETFRIDQGPRFSPTLPAREIVKWLEEADHVRHAPPAPIPMTYGLSDCVIGAIEAPQVIPEGAEFNGQDGPCIVGTGRLYANALAEIVWPAIKDGLVRGLCIECRRREGRRGLQDIIRVTLGGVENNCLPGAVILDAWEGDRA